MSDSRKEMIDAERDEAHEKAKIIKNGNTNLKPLMLTSPKEIELKDKINFSVDEIQKQIRNKKEAVVKLRLKEKGLLHILKEMDKQRFPKMMIEQHKDKEVVWVDNGTYSGLKLVTFYLMEPEIKDGEEGSVFSSKLLYE